MKMMNFEEEQGNAERNGYFSGVEEIQDLRLRVQLREGRIRLKERGKRFQTDRKQRNK